MGCCCFKADRSRAYKSELGAPLLRDVYSHLPENTQVVLIKVQSAKGIKAASSFSNTSEPYVEMKLKPADKVAGEQVKTTSKRPQTLHPVWEPAEKFQFIVSNLSNSKVIFSVYHFNGTSDPYPLGDGVLPLKDLAYGGDYATRTLPLIDPTNGKPTGQLTFEVCLMSALEASLIEEHTVMEYQRWDPVDGWGEKLVLTDPGRWSTANGTRFEKDFDAIVPAIPEGWVVTKAWTTLSTSENVDGWQYAASFDTVDWHSTEISGSSYIRRRTWVREVRKNEPQPSQSAQNGSQRRHLSVADGGGSSGRKYLSSSGDSNTSTKERLKNLFK